jgi:phosphoribosylformimino-5-aminoimidazole carboxamide ribotide isomerase
MIILPAIDLLGGHCVRLKQGKYGQVTDYGDDPAAVARKFMEAGAEWLHVVDLDGARAGEPRNLEAISRVIAAVGKTMAVEVGGGIRTTETAAALLEMGVRRVIVGSRAVAHLDWLRELTGRFPGRVALGVDARGGRVAVHGWQEQTEQTAADVAARVGGLPLAAIIYTDIARDGMMSGPNIEATVELAKAGPLPVIASGGVTMVEDVRLLKAAGVAGAIIGRALYEGTITVEAALAAARD